MRLQATNKNGEIIPTTARVSKGLITIPEVKLRLDLTGAATSNKSDNGKPNLLTIRRRGATLAIAGEGSVRKVLLKFRNETECKEFSDLFVELNPPRMLDNDRVPDGNQLADESGNALCYVARLLNEPDFVSYVNDLEGYLMSTEDGKQMLDSLC